MNAEEIATRLPGAKKTSTGWRACCPAHDDRTPSLDIADGDRGVVMTCRSGGCKTRDIVAAIGITMSDLFPPKEPKATATKPKPPPLSDAEVAEWALNLEDDSDTFDYLTATLRLDPAVLRAECIGSYEFGGAKWVAYPYRVHGSWRFANCRRVSPAPDGDEKRNRFRRHPTDQDTALFRQDVLKPGGIALITEGEKDALAALSMGLDKALGAEIVATPGAQQLRVAVEALRGQSKVYVAFDGDEAGDKAADSLIEALNGRGFRVRPFEVGAKDIAELLAAHGPEEALRRILDVVRQASDPSDSHAHLELLASGQYDPAPLIPTGLLALDNALNGGIPLNKMTVIAARTSHGKTATAMRLTVNMVLGGRNVRVIWCEDDATEFSLRAMSILSGTALPDVLESYRLKTLAEIWRRVPSHKKDLWRAHCRTLLMERPSPQQIADAISRERDCVFIIDHLGEVDWGQGRKHELIGDGLRVIRRAAQDSRCLFIGMAQLNREWDKRKAASEAPDDVKPVLSDIENSGQIEQVARVCVIAEKVMTTQAGGEMQETGEYRYHVFKPFTQRASVTWSSSLASPVNPDPVPVAEPPTGEPYVPPVRKPRRPRQRPLSLVSGEPPEPADEPGEVDP